MLNNVKNTLRKILFKLGIDLTQNQVYDRLTQKIMRKILKVDSNCIDIGCHKGEMMDEMIKNSPQGRHFGFEPIPEYYKFLQKKYESNGSIMIYNKALSQENGKTSFTWVKNAPAFSGIKERSYLIKNPDIEKIEVEMIRLDSLLDVLPTIKLMKIDVEGAELMVLNGSVNLINRDRPVVIFEFGLGASDHYGTTHEEMFRFFDDRNYGIYTLNNFIKHPVHLSGKGFENLYLNKKEYYFIASPLTS